MKKEAKTSENLKEKNHWRKLREKKNAPKESFAVQKKTPTARRTKSKEPRQRVAAKENKFSSKGSSFKDILFFKRMESWKTLVAAFLVVLAVCFAGYRYWKSDAVQMRFVYMWDYQQEIITYSEKNKIDPFLVAAIIKNESHYDHKAKSPVGAIGLMQIMPETGEWAAKEMGLKDYKTDDLFTSGTNIRIGCWYVGELYEEFQGNMALVMMAYNAGRGQTRDWMKENNWDYNFNKVENIPYPETREYVVKVLEDRDKYYELYKNKLN